MFPQTDPGTHFQNLFEAALANKGWKSHSPASTHSSRQTRQLGPNRADFAKSARYRRVTYSSNNSARMLARFRFSEHNGTMKKYPFGYFDSWKWIERDFSTRISAILTPPTIQREHQRKFRIKNYPFWYLDTSNWIQWNICVSVSVILFLSKEWTKFSANVSAILFLHIHFNSFRDKEWTHYSKNSIWGVWIVLNTTFYQNLTSNFMP